MEEESPDDCVHASSRPIECLSVPENRSVDLREIRTDCSIRETEAERAALQALSGEGSRGYFQEPAAAAAVGATAVFQSRSLTR